MLRASSTTAKALAAAISGAAIVASFPNAAEAFTDRQCSVIQENFVRFLRANASNLSNEDKAELRRFNEWIGTGCQGNIVLQGRTEVAVVLDSIQTALASSNNPEFRIRLSPQVTLRPVVTGAAGAPTIPVSIRSNAPTAQQRAPGG